LGFGFILVSFGFGARLRFGFVWGSMLMHRRTWDPKSAEALALAPKPEKKPEKNLNKIPKTKPTKKDSKKFL
jgi:hypothetical protein